MYFALPHYVWRDVDRFDSALLDGIGVEVNLPIHLTANGPFVSAISFLSPSLRERITADVIPEEAPVTVHARVDELSKYSDQYLNLASRDFSQLDRFKEDIAYTHRIGGRSIVVHGGHVTNRNREQAKYMLVFNLVQAVRYAHNYGIEVHLENIMPKATFDPIPNSLAETVEILYRVNEILSEKAGYDGRLKLCFDAGHALLSERRDLDRIVSWIAGNTEHIGCSHLNYTDYVPGRLSDDGDKHLNPLHSNESRAYIEAVFSALANGNPQKEIPIVLEVMPPFLSHFKSNWRGNGTHPANVVRSIRWLEELKTTLPTS